MVASAFGPRFADAVFALRPGVWHGPVESGYGLHLVRVSSKDAGWRRDFAEVRTQVLERWREQKQRESEAGFFKRLMEKYDVVVDDGLKAVIDPRTIKPVADTTR
jgi:parvulin-like peptidyl-prolyl isomerase